MDPDLSHRLGDALGQHFVDPGERNQIVNAAVSANGWQDLPGDARSLVEDIESRAGWLGATGGVSSD